MLAALGQKERQTYLREVNTKSLSLQRVSSRLIQSSLGQANRTGSNLVALGHESSAQS